MLLAYPLSGYLFIRTISKPDYVRFGTFWYLLVRFGENAVSFYKICGHMRLIVVTDFIEWWG